MPVNPASIGNAYKRSDEYRKQKRQKSQEKLKRRMAVKKDEEEGEGGEERKKVRLLIDGPSSKGHDPAGTDDLLPHSR